MTVELLLGLVFGLLCGLFISDLTRELAAIMTIRLRTKAVQKFEQVCKDALAMAREGDKHLQATAEADRKPFPAKAPYLLGKERLN